MFKLKYNKISHFDFTVLAAIVTESLDYPKLPLVIKDKKEVTFITSKIANDFAFAIRNKYNIFNNTYINTDNMFKNYVAYGFLDRESITPNDKQALLQIGLWNECNKYKYEITDKCKRFVEQFNTVENHYLFSYITMSAKLVNILCALMSADTDLNEPEINEILNTNAKLINAPIIKPTSGSFESINRLIAKNLLRSLGKDADNKIKYRITPLGRNVLNLVLDVDEQLAVPESEEHRTLEINTPYKTVLVFPLWG